MVLWVVSNLVTQTKQNPEKLTKNCLACPVIKCPSCPHPPSLPGRRSQPGSAFSSWLTGKFSSRSIWLAGSLRRQLCWQLLLSLSCARAEDTPLRLASPWQVTLGVRVGSQLGMGCTSAHTQPAPAAPKAQGCESQQSPARASGELGVF